MERAIGNVKAMGDNLDAGQELSLWIKETIRPTMDAVSEEWKEAAGKIQGGALYQPVSI